MDIGRLMLSNLPNLKKLILRCGSKTDLIFGAALQNVQEVMIENGPHNSFHASISMLEALYLLSLPRLWKLIMNSPVTVRAAQHRGILVRQFHTSTVTDIHLVLEASSDADFLALVRVPTQLQRLNVTRFQGSKCRPEVPGRVSIHDGTLFRALELHKGGLETLQVFGSKLEHCNCWDKIGSLRDFPRLKYLAIDPTLFSATPSQSSRVRCLSDVLPASLETIKFFRDPRFGTVIADFSWVEIVLHLAIRFRQRNIKNITILNWAAKPFRTRCRRCSWVSAQCIECRDSGREYGIYYKSADTQRIERLCVDQGITLWGPWFDHVPHPADHQPENYAIADIDYEDEAVSFSSL